jgi:hypothetical protein
LSGFRRETEGEQDETEGDGNEEKTEKVDLD